MQMTSQRNCRQSGICSEGETVVIKHTGSELTCSYWLVHSDKTKRSLDPWNVDLIVERGV